MYFKLVELNSRFQVAMMSEETVNKHIILGFVYEKIHVKMNISKIGFHSLLSWSKVSLELEFHEAMTFGD